MLDHQRAWRWKSGAALVRAEKLHLTLHFIGAVPRQRLTQLIAELKVPFTPFELDVGQPALWHPGLAVLEPHASPAGLLRLHEALSEALLRLDLPREMRPYRPHITLARRAGRSEAPAGQPALRWLVQDYALMESVAAPLDQYRLLQRYA
ncbi:MAG: 2'-5' RNA ligase family protein [Pseudomonadota bacterium]|nr:2'-5' RNA ligase family protein [Pseudomonadota bacterium]